MERAVFRSRSEAIQKAVTGKLARLDLSRLALESRALTSREHEWQRRHARAARKGQNIGGIRLGELARHKDMIHPYGVRAWCDRIFSQRSGQLRCALNSQQREQGFL